ncbi:hypothetical protein [uncultured Methanobrevibacter sp.]|uniref:hypothetical protein n=1 Tax=uncultured Methanobrevibacter sp. TaxID=253161 RepID=UPI0025D6BB24|nr:hypothetical protein [uncultured Methanobrevibacter sp.]
MARRNRVFDDDVMTEKRFIRNIVGQIYDVENDKFLDEDYAGKPIGYEDEVVERLNYFHEENLQLRWSIQVRNELILKEVQINETYLDRIKHFEDTVKEAIKHEKTEMGQSVLKNLAANLGIDYDKL